MKKSAIITLAIIAACFTVTEALAKTFVMPDIRYQNVNLEPHDDEVTLSMTINGKFLRPGKDREYTITPTLFNPAHTDSIVFQPVVVSGHDLYYLHLRNNDMKLFNFYKAGKFDSIAYTARALTPEWLDSAQIVLAVNMRNCCDVRRFPDIPIGKVQPRPLAPIIEYSPKNKGIKLPDKTREIKGRAYINFPVNRTKLYPDYMNNPSELLKIISTIDSVKSDPDIRVDSLFIKGFASPEGPYRNNVRLARGRTETLKKYVENMYSFPKDFIQTSSEAEDWEGLREYVKNSDIPDREGILSIIDSNLAPDPKNSEIQRRYPREYEMLLKYVYPTLRHSDYRIYFTIRTYTDPNEIISLTKTAPGKLSEEEVEFAIASLEPDTPEYNELSETAARLYPHNSQFNLDAANIAINRGDYKGAAMYLNRAGNSPRAIYTRGVLAVMQGNYPQAKDYYMQAAKMGAPYAAEALEKLTEAGDSKLMIVPIEDNPLIPVEDGQSVPMENN